LAAVGSPSWSSFSQSVTEPVGGAMEVASLMGWITPPEKD
jgi:hypothetical protein